MSRNNINKLVNFLSEEGMFRGTHLDLANAVGMDYRTLQYVLAEVRSESWMVERGYYVPVVGSFREYVVHQDSSTEFWALRGNRIRLQMAISNLKKLVVQFELESEHHEGDSRELINKMFEQNTDSIVQALAMLNKNVTEQEVT